MLGTLDAIYKRSTERGAFLSKYVDSRLDRIHDAMVFLAHQPENGGRTAPTATTTP